MSSYLKFCSCKSCKAGRHREGNKAVTRRVVRSVRQRTKQALREGNEPEPRKGVGYTD